MRLCTTRNAPASGVPIRPVGEDEVGKFVMGVLPPPGQDLQELLGDARMLKNHRADCVAVYRGRSYLAERGRASHSRAGIQHRRGDEDFLRSQDGEHRSPERRCTTELYALRDDDVEIVCGVPLGVNLNLLCLGEDHQLPMRRGGHRRRVDVTGAVPSGDKPNRVCLDTPELDGDVVHHGSVVLARRPVRNPQSRTTCGRPPDFGGSPSCGATLVSSLNPPRPVVAPALLPALLAAFSVRLPVLRTLEPFRGYVPNNR